MDADQIGITIYVGGLCLLVLGSVIGSVWTLRSGRHRR